MTKDSNIAENPNASTFSLVIVVLFALCWVVAWTHPLGFGPDPTMIPVLVGWSAAATGSALVLIIATRAQWAKSPNIGCIIFLVLAVCIIIRSGPQPLHALAFGIVCLTVAAAAQGASVWIHHRWWSSTLTISVLTAAAVNAVSALIQYTDSSIPALDAWIPYSPFQQAVGQLRQKNQLGMLMVIGLAFLLLNSPTESSNWKKRLPVALLLTLAAAASTSRVTAFAVLLLLALILLARKNLSRDALLLSKIIGVIFIVSSFALPVIFHANTNLLSRIADTQIGCESRWYLFQSAVQMIREQPLLGVGWRGFMYSSYMQDFDTTFCGLADHSHNVYLQLAAEAGLPIALFFAGLSIWVIWFGRQALFESGIRRVAYVVVCLIWLHSQVEFPLWEPIFLWLFAIALGVVTSSLSIPFFDRLSEKSLRQSSKSVHKLGIGLVLICTVSLGIAVTALSQYFSISRIDNIPKLLAEKAKSNALQEFLGSHWMFGGHLEYLQIQTLPINPSTAKKIRRACDSALKFSPEPLVIACMIDTSKILGDQVRVEFHQKRFKIMFPQEFEKYQKM